MIPVLLTLLSYDKLFNRYQARLENGEIIFFDPFVSCAINMTDEDYEKGKGIEFVGRKCVITIYTVYVDDVVPHEGGLRFLD